MAGDERFGRASRLTFCAVGGVLALLFGGTNSGSNSTATESQGISTCSEPGTKKALRGFVSAYNRGNSGKLDQLFDGEPGFEWYSSGAPGSRVGRAAFRRSTLIAYFEDRHEHGDRMRLLRFGHIFKGYGGPEYANASNFSFYLERRATDFNDGRRFRIPGKGALVCEGRQPKIIVMSIGGPSL